MIIEAREDTVTLRGAIKSNIWPAIQAAVALLLKNHPTGIILDCSGVESCTVKGAQTFADAFAYINAHNARIMVAALAPELLEIVKAVPGVRSQVPVVASVEEAHASLRLEEVTPQRGKARQAALVPLAGKWRRALCLAGLLARGESCEMHIVDLIKVPLTLPLGSPLPDREAAGQARLEEAQAIAKEAGLRSFPHVERCRSRSAGLNEIASQIGADFAVVSIDKVERPTPRFEQSDAMLLLEAASIEVSLVKGAPEDPELNRRNAVVPAVGAWDHALEHACKIVQADDARVTLVSIIVVDRTEPIDAPKPDEEAVARDRASEAARIGRRYGVKVDCIVNRVRDPILGFMRLFESNPFDLAVVGVKRETEGDYHVAHVIAEELLQELPCETIFLRVAD